MSPAGKPGRNRNKISRPRPAAGVSRFRLDEGGFAYVMVLAAVVVMAILAEAAYVLASYQVRRDRERELLFRGLAYERAIQNYYLSSPPGTPSFPHDLQDLLLDPRYAGHKRYLRALYPDPMGKDWNLVRGPGNVIMGVASTGPEKPLKQGNFPPFWAAFEGAQRYSDWLFTCQLGQPVSVIPASDGESSP